MFFVYILKNENNEIYIGQTKDLSERLERHNSGRVPATKAKGPWRVFYKEEFETRTLAVRREKALKSGQGRKWIREVLK